MPNLDILLLHIKSSRWNMLSTPIYWPIRLQIVFWLLFFRACTSFPFSLIIYEGLYLIIKLPFVLIFDMLIFVIHKLCLTCHTQIFHGKISLFMNVPIMILRYHWWRIIICWWFCSLSLKARCKTTGWGCFWKTDLWNILTFCTSNYWNTNTLFRLKSSFHLTVEIDYIFVLTKFVLIDPALWSRIVVARVFVRYILIYLIHDMLTGIWTIIAQEWTILKRCHRRCLWICSIQQLAFVLILSWWRWQMLVCLMLNWFVVTLLKTRIDTHSNSSLLSKMVIVLIFLSL